MENNERATARWRAPSTNNIQPDAAEDKDDDARTTAAGEKRKFMSGSFPLAVSPQPPQHPFERPRFRPVTYLPILSTYPISPDSSDPAAHQQASAHVERATSPFRRDVDKIRFDVPRSLVGKTKYLGRLTLGEIEGALSNEDAFLRPLEWKEIPGGECRSEMRSQVQQLSSKYCFESLPMLLARITRGELGMYERQAKAVLGNHYIYPLFNDAAAAIIPPDHISIDLRSTSLALKQQQQQQSSKQATSSTHLSSDQGSEDGDEEESSCSSSDDSEDGNDQSSTDSDSDSDTSSPNPDAMESAPTFQHKTTQPHAFGNLRLSDLTEYAQSLQLRYFDLVDPDALAFCLCCGARGHELDECPARRDG